MGRKIDERCGFAAAYRDGLGLAAVAVLADADGTRIIAPASDEHEALSDAGSVQTRWWCRRSEDAERVAASAGRIFRRESNAADTAIALARGEAAILAAAKKLHIALYSEQEIAGEAMNIAARVDAELQQQRARGDLKSVNKAYRAYRLETSGRGERVLRYDEWMRQYRENLVRQIAAALREI